MSLLSGETHAAPDTMTGVGRLWPRERIDVLLELLGQRRVPRVLRQRRPIRRDVASGFESWANVFVITVDEPGGALDVAGDLGHGRL